MTLTRFGKNIPILHHLLFGADWASVMAGGEK